MIDRLSSLALRFKNSFFYSLQQQSGFSSSSVCRLILVYALSSPGAWP